MRVSPWDSVTQKVDPVRSAEPGSYWWDDDQWSGNCALRGHAGEVLRVIIQAGSSWMIYQDEILLDVRADRKAARDRALEMYLASGH